MLKAIILSCRSRAYDAIHIARINTSSSTKNNLNSYYWDTKWKNNKELSDYLMSNILFKDANMIAFNKPNGVPMHSPKYEEHSKINPVHASDFVSIESCKPHLMKELGVKEMHGFLSQNRLHSGIIMFCYDKEASHLLSSHFKKAKSNKRLLTNYDMVCMGECTYTSGSKTLYITQQIIKKNLLSVESDAFRTSRKMRISTTLLNFNLVKQSKIGPKSDASYIQVAASAVKWDALELMAVRNLTPALGDHCYSSRIKTVLDRQILMQQDEVSPKPQEIPKDICNLLEVRVDKTVDIPLHIHCSKIVVPRLLLVDDKFVISKICLANELNFESPDESFESENSSKQSNIDHFTVTISAPKPQFFTETLKRLDLL